MGFGYNFKIQNIFQTVVLFFGIVGIYIIRYFRFVQNFREINTLCFVVINGFVHVQFLGLSDHFIDRSESETRHNFS
ncbi:MAG: Uncharacterised protein [Flavobacteriaceae bacterium]|nr:MAG: Uncharacterised protein [Flavobacteriaceae bacterium]